MGGGTRLRKRHFSLNSPLNAMHTVDIIMDGDFKKKMYPQRCFPPTKYILSEQTAVSDSNCH